MKKMTKADFGKLMNMCDNTTVNMEFESTKGNVSIAFKKRLSVVERSIMINDIVSLLCLDDDYIPSIETAVTAYFLLSNFTNLPLPYLLNKEKDAEATLNTKALDSALFLWYELNIAQCLRESMGNNAFDDLMKEIQKAIDFNKQLTMQNNSPVGKIVGAVDPLFDIFEKAAPQLKDLNVKELQEAVKKINNIGDDKIIQFLPEMQDKE